MCRWWLQWCGVCPRWDFDQRVYDKFDWWVKWNYVCKSMILIECGWIWTKFFKTEQWYIFNYRCSTVIPSFSWLLWERISLERTPYITIPPFIGPRVMAISSQRRFCSSVSQPITISNSITIRFWRNERWKGEVVLSITRFTLDYCENMFVESKE